MQPQTIPPGGPVLSTPATADKEALLAWARTVAAAFNTSLGASAPTGGRPTTDQLAYIPGGGVGFSMFDTTLAKPIWWTGAAWVDASGATV